MLTWCTFSDYHSIYNWSGARSPAYIFNGAWSGSNLVGMYASDLFTHDDGSTIGVDVGSRLSKVHYFLALTMTRVPFRIIIITGNLIGVEVMYSLWVATR